MTTLRDRPEHGPGGEDQPLGYQGAHCPHCGSLMEPGVELPWPNEPALCNSCERWVGRARAVSALAAANDAAVADRPHADDRPGAEGVRRSQRLRSTRSDPIQRRRARELGPPPVPRLSAEPEALAPGADADDHHDLGFAATSAWDAPATGTDRDGFATPAGEGLAPTPTSPEPGASPAPVEEAHDGDSSDEVATDEWADPASPAPEDTAEELGPPAPFSPSAAGAEAGRAGSGPFTTPRPSKAPAGSDGAHPEASPSPDAPRDAFEIGHTLPFWSVPSEPEPSGRRWSLPTLRRPTLRRPRLRRPTRAGVLRALPVVLLVVGALLLIEGAFTVLWKEPFSAIFAAQTQNALGEDLEKLERENAAAEAAAARSKEAAVRYQRKRAVALNRDTGIGEPTGRLRIKRLGLNEVVVQGTDDTTLQAGPGHYTQTPLPGQKGNWTVGIAGHRTTYGAPFRRINELKRGDEIVYTMPYGRFTYEVEGTKIVDDSETGVFVPKGYNRIALTACHPLYSAAQRIIAYGKLKKSEPLGGARRAARS